MAIALAPPDVGLGEGGGGRRGRQDLENIRRRHAAMVGSDNANCRGRGRRAVGGGGVAMKEAWRVG